MICLTEKQGASIMNFEQAQFKDIKEKKEYKVNSGRSFHAYNR